MNEDLKSLSDRLAIVEETLTYLLEEKEAAESAANPTPVASAAAAATARPITEANLARQDHYVQASPPRPSRRTTPVNWLGTVAVICFVMAGAFIVKLAVDSGWLTPARQIGIAALLGFVLIAAGFVVTKLDRVYASLLPAAGVIILYLTAVAAHSYHGLIGFELAVGFVAAISCLCIWLYTALRNEVYPITGALGAYLVPFLLGAKSHSDFTIYYFVLCTISFASISVWLESRLLAIVASYLAIVATLILSLELPDTMLFARVLPLHFAAFVVAAVIQSLKGRAPMTTNEAWAYFPVLLLFYVGEYALVYKLSPTLAPWISLSFAGFLIGVYFLSKKTLEATSLESSNLIAAFTSVVVFHSFYIEIVPDNFKPWLLPAIIFASAFLPATRVTVASKNVIPMLAVALIALCEYVRVMFYLIGDQDPFPIILVGLLSAGAALFFYIKRQSRVAYESSTGVVLLAAAHTLTILALYRLLENVSSLAVSASWLAYAVAIMAWGFAIKDKVIAKSALAALGFAAAKALLYDAAAVATGLRIVCLLLTGAVLYGCGLLLKRIDDWDAGANKI